jgi:hypothetical protein
MSETTYPSNYRACIVIGLLLLAAWIVIGHVAFLGLGTVVFLIGCRLRTRWAMDGKPNLD